MLDVVTHTVPAVLEQVVESFARAFIQEHFEGLHLSLVQTAVGVHLALLHEVSDQVGESGVTAAMVLPVDLLAVQRFVQDEHRDVGHAAGVHEVLVVGREPERHQLEPKDLDQTCDEDQAGVQEEL